MKHTGSLQDFVTGDHTFKGSNKGLLSFVTSLYLEILTSPSPFDLFELTFPKPEKCSGCFSLFFLFQKLRNVVDRFRHEAISSR